MSNRRDDSEAAAGPSFKPNPPGCRPWLAAEPPAAVIGVQDREPGGNRMHRLGTILRTPMPAAARLPCLAAVVSFAVGCSSMPRLAPAPAAVSQRPPAASETNAADAGRGEFTVGVSMLDAWNAVGQILVRVPDVGYEGRAQMLGIYVVRYRGEKFLILTRALVMRSQDKGMLTRVGAVLPNGKPNGSAAAVELLGLLQRRLPAELARIAAGGR